MSVELISVLIAVLAIGATLAGVILTGNRGLRQDMRQDMAQLESRLRDDIKQLWAIAWDGWSMVKPSWKGCWKDCARPSPDGRRLAGKFRHVLSSLGGPMLTRRPMYSARTLLVLVSFVGGLMEVASAQHKYIFPQFAFGGGWESTLMVQALGSNTTCTFSAQDRSFTMRGLFGNNISGTSILLTFGMNEWTILKTATPQGMTASSGMAVLDCDEEVSANTLFSLEVGGSLVAEALVESSEEIVSGEPTAKFLADHRDGARFAMAVANPSDQPLDVSIAVGDLGGQQIGEVTVNVPGERRPGVFCGRTCNNIDRSYRTGFDMALQ